MGFDRVKLKGMLMRKNIYQYDFAKELNVTESYLSKILKGRIKPSSKLIARMSTILQNK